MTLHITQKITLVGFLLFVLGINDISAQEWLTDFEKAKQIASENDKHILLVFAGSDWCAPCIKLEKQVLDTQEFKEKAKQHYVLVKADFPRKKKNQLSAEQQVHNNKLAEKYNKSGGFPMVIVLDKAGEKQGEVGYKKVAPKEYLDLLNQMIN